MSGRPDKVGGFTVLGELGRGGMGVVYRAVGADGRPAALKVISRELSGEATFVARFEREARLASSVRHPNLVAMLGSGFEENLAWIAFEIVGGGSLKDRLKAEGRLPWREVARIGAQIARGLAAIHGAGLIHRDVKPANVLLDSQGNAKVSDLGLARRSRGSQGLSVDLTRTGEILGTLEYASPEQIDGSKNIDARTDLYSLGATLYDLLTGHPPFHGSSGVALMKKHLVERPTSPRSIVSGVPDELDRLILRLMEKDPDARGPGAVELAKELHGLASSGSGGARSLPKLALASALGLSLVAVVVLVPRLRGQAAEEPGVVSRPTVVVAPVVSRAQAPSPPPRPAWFNALADRPVLLPGIHPTERPGEYENEVDGSVLVWVPPPTRAVHGFFIGKYEVAVEQFRRFVEARHYRTAAERLLEERGIGGRILKDPRDTTADQIDCRSGLSWRNPVDPTKPALDDHPVVQVAYGDCRDYCAWAGLDLPTEEEWLRAARSKDGGPLPWGNSTLGEGSPRVANVADEALRRSNRIQDNPSFPPPGPWQIYYPGYDDGYAGTAPVTEFPEGESGCGARNLIGNVFEWLQGEYDGDGNPVTGSTPMGVPMGNIAIGGSYILKAILNGQPRQFVAFAGYWSEDVGFRVAKRAR
jgi:formylglycine-generating enzyme required for sulfatase activity